MNILTKKQLTASICLLFIVIFNQSPASSARKHGRHSRKRHGDDGGGGSSQRVGRPTSTLNATDTCLDCECPSSPPECPPGVSLLMDGCKCCKVCARQRGDSCDNQKRVCDSHKKLYCDEETSTCKMQEGSSCMVGGNFYENGEVFQPSCKVTCTCIDGDIGCAPTCLNSGRPPASCMHPRQVRRKGACCTEWVCPGPDFDTSDFVFAEVKSKPPQQSVYLREDSCMVQTTNWSPCSTTCGYGLSDRVTNDNPECEMKKETRLCKLRPCQQVFKRQTGKRHRTHKSQTQTKRSGKVRYLFSGCTSTDIYRPKYCGHSGSRCKTPTQTKTIEINFDCPNGQQFSKNFMWIKRCSTQYSSCKKDDDFFSLSTMSRGRDVRGDTDVNH